jgi:hypothetical protein
MKQPCLDCGTPTNGTRCQLHAATHNTQINTRATNKRRAQGPRTYNSRGYRHASAAVRATATQCWICGEGPRHDDPWQADHVIPVKNAGGTGPLAPAHRSCNIGRANRLRAGKPDPALTRNTTGTISTRGTRATRQNNRNTKASTRTPPPTSQQPADPHPTNQHKTPRAPRPPHADPNQPNRPATAPTTQEDGGHTPTPTVSQANKQPRDPAP